MAAWDIDPEYKWFVVNPSGDIIAGNEYREDAQEFVSDNADVGERLKVVAARTLKSQGIDPYDTVNWKNLRSTLEGSWGQGEGYSGMGEGVDQVIESFPPEFGLRAWPGRRFRISRVHSYMSPQLGVQIVTEIFNEDRGEWESFARETPSGIRRELVALGGIVEDVPPDVGPSGANYVSEWGPEDALGASRSDHQFRARQSVKDLRSSLRKAERSFEEGDCKEASISLHDAQFDAGIYFTHLASEQNWSRTQGKPLPDDEGFSERIEALRDDIERVCLRPKPTKRRRKKK